MPDVLGPIPSRTTVRQQAVDAVRAAIVDGRLVPGERYSVEQLARQLGVSRTPVREALLELESRGMVRFARNQGFRIVTLGVEELRDVLTMRLLAEVPAAHRATVRATEQELVELSGRLATMRELRRSGDSVRLLAADRAFHRRILELAGNPRLTEHVEQLRDLLTLRGHYGDGVRRELDTHLADHDAIVAAMLAGDPAAAGRAAGRHVGHVAGSLLRHAGDPTGELSWTAAVGLSH